MCVANIIQICVKLILSKTIAFEGEVWGVLWKFLDWPMAYETLLFSDIAICNIYMNMYIYRQHCMMISIRINIDTNQAVHISIKEPGPRLNIKTVLSTYGDFHVKDKMAPRTSYL